MRFTENLMKHWVQLSRIRNHFNSNSRGLLRTFSKASNHLPHRMEDSSQKIKKVFIKISFRRHRWCHGLRGRLLRIITPLLPVWFFQTLPEEWFLKWDQHYRITVVATCPIWYLQVLHLNFWTSNGASLELKTSLIWGIKQSLIRK